MESLCGVVPRFPRMKCAIKPTLGLVVSSPGDAALLASLSACPPAACTTCSQELPGPQTLYLAQATQGKRGRCAVSWPLFSDKIHPVSPLALRSSVPLPGVSKRGSEKAVAVFVALSASRVHAVAQVTAAPRFSLAPLTGWGPPFVSEAALPAVWARSFGLLTAP